MVTVPPSVARIDAHQHFWRRQRGDYTWLRDDDAALAPLQRDFEPADLAPLMHAHGVGQTVLVQAAATAAETDFMLGLADEQAFVGAVVGWVDLTADDLADQLARRRAHPKFKGIRPMLQDLADTEWISHPAQVAALQQVQRLGLRLDALVRPQHLNALARSLQLLPELPVVVNHAAKPVLGGDAGVADAAALQAWRQDLQTIARLPATMCKFSGLLTQVRGPASGRVADDVAALRPVWDALLEGFGPPRLMWGSDWPVLRLASDYGHWLAVCEVLVGELSDSEQAQIWAGNAERFYALE